MSLENDFFLFFTEGNLVILLYKKVKFSLEQAVMTQKASSSISLLFS
jgi:hypothetical protein